MNQAVQRAVTSYFEDGNLDSATALEIWESTPYNEYDGDPYQFMECLGEGLDGFRLEDDGLYNPVIHRA